MGGLKFWPIHFGIHLISQPFKSWVWCFRVLYFIQQPSTESRLKTRLYDLAAFHLWHTLPFLDALQDLRGGILIRLALDQSFFPMGPNFPVWMHSCFVFTPSCERDLWYTLSSEIALSFLDVIENLLEVRLEVIFLKLRAAVSKGQLRWR